MSILPKINASNTAATGLQYARAAGFAYRGDPGYPKDPSEGPLAHGLHPFDLKTGRHVDRAVVEVSAAEGWLKYYEVDRRGRLILERENGDQARDLAPRVATMFGRFELRRSI
jgi:hypothetical protein